VAYIDAQKEHHRKRSFQDEFIEFLDKHEIEYDPRYADSDVNRKPAL
jgi:putative transposase